MTKKLVGLFVVIALMVSGSAYSQIEKGYKGTKWGMGIAEVRQIIPHEMHDGTYFSGCSQDEIEKYGQKERCVIRPGYNYFAKVLRVPYLRKEKGLVLLGQNSRAYWFRDEKGRIVELDFWNDRLFFVHVMYPEDLLVNITYENFLLKAIEQLGRPAGFEDDEKSSALIESLSDLRRGKRWRRLLDGDKLTWATEATRYVILYSGPWQTWSQVPGSSLTWMEIFGRYEDPQEYKKRKGIECPTEDIGEYARKASHVVIYDQDIVDSVQTILGQEEEKENAKSLDDIDF
jgi:hypothetical protein